MTTTISLPEPILCFTEKEGGYLICGKKNGKYVDSLCLLYTSGTNIAKALSIGKVNGCEEHVPVRVFAEPTIVQWAKDVEQKAAESKKAAVDAVEEKYKKEMENFQKSGDVFALSLVKKGDEIAALAKEKSGLEEKLKEKEKEIALMAQRMKDALQEKDIAMTTALADLAIKKDEERDAAVKIAVKVASQTLEHVKLQFGELN